MRYMIYARRSKESTAKQVSITDQILLCRRYAANHLGWVEFGEPLVHDGVSGGDGERFFYLDHEIKKRQVEVVIAYSLDRIGRDATDVLTWLKRMVQWGVEVHTVEAGRVDIVTAMGGFKIGIEALMAEFQRVQTSEKTRNAMKRLREMGRRLSRFAPYGYSYTVDSKVVENGDEMLVVAQVLDLHRHGLTSWGIAKALEVKGAKNRNGRLFDYKAVGKIVARFEKGGA